MPEPSFDQGEQHVGNQLNVAGDVVLQPSILPPPPGRVIGRWPGRTAYFTGRQDALNALDVALASSDAALLPPPQALHGMPGVGKTSIAVEYVARCWNRYHTVAWLPAENVSDLKAAIAGLGPFLSPPTPQTDNIEADYQEARRWFSVNSGWLIVADNVEDPNAVRRALPPAITGRLLMTTRREDPGNGAVSVRVDRMPESIGALFLLRRAKRLTSDQTIGDAAEEWRASALAISRRFDGLPLALGQAGAYIASRGVTAAQYLERFEDERERLLDFVGDADHETVTATFKLALQEVERTEVYGPAAAQLVRLCAFLAPDDIPDDIFRKAPEAVEEPLRSFLREDWDWGEVVETATRFALLNRNADGSSLSLHRLAADVIRDELGEESREAFLEATVRTLNEAFPVAEYETWNLVARLLPHAEVVFEHTSQAGIAAYPIFRMMAESGRYLRQRARFAESEVAYVKALEVGRALPEHGDWRTANLYNSVGVVVSEQGRREDALEWLEEARAIYERGSLPEDEHLASIYDNLAQAYAFAGRSDEAESMSRVALKITGELSGHSSLKIVQRLNNLADILATQGRLAEAITLAWRALTIRREASGLDHPDHARSLYNVGSFHALLGHRNTALPYLVTAIEMFDRLYDTSHPSCGYSRSTLARCCYEDGDLERARSLLLEAILIQEPLLDPEHPQSKSAVEALASVEAALLQDG